MKIARKFLVSAAVVAATLASAGAVLANQGAGMGREHAGMDGGAGHGARGHEGRGGPGRHMGGPEDAAAVATRLDELKTKLNITAAQDAAWQRYAGLVKQHAQTRDEMRKQMQTQRQTQASQGAQAASGSVTAPDRGAQRETMRKFRDEQRSAHEAARKELLAALTPEQRTVAEEAMRGGRGHGRGMAHQGQGQGSHRGH